MGSHPEYCRVFGRIPGLHTGNTSSSSHPNSDNQNRHCQVSPVDAESPWVESHCLKPQPGSTTAQAPPAASQSFQMPTTIKPGSEEAQQMLSPFTLQVLWPLRCSPLRHDNQGGPLCMQPSVDDTVNIPTSPPHSETSSLHSSLGLHHHHCAHPCTTCPFRDGLPSLDASQIDFVLP